MGEVVRLPRAKGPARGAGDSICRRGFHRWVIVQGRPFEVKKGRLVTCYRCLRCGKEKVEAR